MIVHSYLRAIGFSNIEDRTELERLFSIIMEEPTTKRVYKKENDKEFVEIEKRFTKNMGIVIRGEVDRNGKFYMEHYFPCFYSSLLSTKEEVTIIKKVDTDSYTGICYYILLVVY